MSTEWRYGWRFLNAAGGTNPGTPREFYSTLPRQDETWSDWTEHPDAAAPDGKDCGPNRLHVMLKPDARYAPSNWWPWYARWRPEDEIGRSQEKASVARYQLRRLRPTAWHRIIRLGWCHEANLSGANLRRANLSEANLYGADLSEANLYVADLRGANLSRANLIGANLGGADLSEASLIGADLGGASLGEANLSRADLYEANLYEANLSGADLSRADLRRANLYGANLYGADLRGANLYRADLSRADLSRANLGGANLSGADLYGANLYGAIYSDGTVWPEGFIPNEEMIRA